MVEQELHEWLLHAGLLRMNAGGHQTERGAVASVNICARIHVGARAKQQAGNFDDVLRRLLAVAFDTVGRDIMKKRGPMFPAGAPVHKPGMSAQQAAKSRDLAGDDRIGRGFKLCFGGIFTGHIANMPEKGGPTGKSMRARDDELRIGQLATR